MFFFAYTPQRERVTAAMARFDADAAATARRKAYADTLRVTVGNFDYAVSGRAADRESLATLCRDEGK